MSKLFRNIVRFVLLVFLQVFVLNNVLIQGLITPSLYLLFIILLPKDLPNWAVMFSGFLLGLCLDVFMNTLGMHAVACVFIAFLRPTILSILMPEKALESRRYTPSVKLMGWIPFLTYALILTFIHHVTFFSLEVFNFNDIFYLSLKILLSTILTLLMIVIFELLFVSPQVKS